MKHVGKILYCYTILVSPVTVSETTGIHYAACKAPLKIIIVRVQVKVVRLSRDMLHWCWIWQ